MAGTGIGRKENMMKARNRTLLLLILTLALTPIHSLYAMHISEGILPPQWAGLWFAVALPFMILGLRTYRIHKDGRYSKPMVALVGSAVFIISCMPIPVPLAGTCSHPCGTGLAAILIGPFLTVVVASVALILQALFMAHGGLTTLGANIVSMGIAGSFVGYGVFHGTRKLGVPVLAAAFLAGVLSDWATYAVTSVELASALHGNHSFLHMFYAVAVAFIPTQLPLGIFEGFLCAGAYRFIQSRRPALLEQLAGAGAI